MDGDRAEDLGVGHRERRQTEVARESNWTARLDFDLNPGPAMCGWAGMGVQLVASVEAGPVQVDLDQVRVAQVHDRVIGEVRPVSRHRPIVALCGARLPAGRRCSATTSQNGRPPAGSAEPVVFDLAKA